MIDRLIVLGQKRVMRILYYLTLVSFLVLALLPQSGQPGFPQADKVIHCLVFLFITVWGQLTHQRTPLVFIAIALLAYGGLMEMLQGLTSWRMASAGDLVADAGGILAGIACWRLIVKPQRTL